MLLEFQEKMKIEELLISVLCEGNTYFKYEFAHVHLGG